ncbi:Protein disulfide-isomerase A4 [Aphelenchoides bicaudatus]|nr:Protein disulfide-isomerase A4 [Aphelenchoides bicaudatus]
MRFAVLLALLLLVTLAHSEYVKDEGVYVLTESNFEEFLKEHPTALIEFYAPWCGHCKKLDPEYKKASGKVDVPLAKVDATVEVELGKKYAQQGYPTIKFWQDGKEPIDYDGGRDSESIVAWLKEKTDPNYKPPPEEVVALTTETMDKFIADKPIMLVEFYAPWCGHCKNLAPELEKAAQRLKAHKIPIAKIDATVEKSLADQYGVSGYPTIKILRFGRRFDYNGPRDADGIVKYMLEQSKSAAQELRTPSEARKFINEADVTILGFFASTDSPQFEAFADAAEVTRPEFRSVGFTSDPASFKEFNAKPNDIMIFLPKIFVSKYDEKSKTLNKDGITKEDVLNFWRENCVPLVGQRTKENVASKYGKNPLVVVYYSVDYSFEHREGTNYWRNKILPIANKYKNDKYRFAISNEEEFAEELQQTGLGDSGLEHNVIAFGFDGKKYPMRPEIYDEELEENLEAFMKDLNSGKVKPHVKSAPAPTSDKAPVKTLVASNFEKVLKDETKDYLVEFYAPWCGHCKKFEPAYVELAKKLSSDKNLVLAKFDATANDPHDDFKVEGFPTIYFAPAGLKHKPIKYTGNRSPDDLISFMKKHAVNSFKSKDEL